MDSAPQVVDQAANKRFSELAARFGLDPDSRWVGGYVQHEWNHIRHVLECLNLVGAKKTLEFGCNIGATSIVAEKLGALVTGIDTGANVIALAKVNAARFGCTNCKFIHLADTRALPFEDSTFGVILCNSVLEYVAPDHRSAVLAELDRTLHPGGTIVLHGTSNKLWPVETHSRSWAANWVPSFVSPRAIRGVNPLSIRRALPRYHDLLTNDRKAFVDIKTKQGMSRSTATALGAVSRAIGISPGMLLRSFMLVLKKPSDSPSYFSRMPTTRE
jgi:ubiquinone/menaquinone biosynthesis C-methylase UbiE